MEELRRRIKKIDDAVDEGTCAVLICASFASMLLSVLLADERVFGWVLAILSLSSTYLLLGLSEERLAATLAVIEGAAFVAALLLLTPIRIFLCGFSTLPKFYAMRWKRFVRLQKARGKNPREDDGVPSAEWEDARDGEREEAA